MSRPVAWRWAFALTVVVSLVVLYAPRATGGGVPHLDKLVHLLLFGSLAATGLRAGIRPARLVPLLLLHALTSELVQEHLLAGRGGDAGDLAADALGVLGVTAVDRASWRRERPSP